MRKIPLYQTRDHLDQIPEEFFEYFISANGDAIKVYLYVYRCLYKGSLFTLEELSDILHLPEDNIISALKYWEEKGVIRLLYDADDNLDGLVFTQSRLPAVKPAMFSASKPENNSHVHKKADVPHTNPQPSDEELSELLNDVEFMEFIELSKYYLRRELKPDEVARIWVCYKEFSDVALMEHLLEYCVEQGHRSISYICSVAQCWYANGYRTLEQVKVRQSVIDAVKKVFNIDRNLGKNEYNYIDRWINEYGFSIEDIVKACELTWRKNQGPNFPYANGILMNWVKS